MAAYRYWRIHITAARYAGTVQAGVKDTRLAHVGFLQAAGTAAPAMVGADSPTPLVATSSSLWSGAYEAWRAFDAAISDGSCWISGGALKSNDWVAIDFGAPYEFAAVAIAPDGEGNPYAPVDFTVQASSTGAWAGEQVVVHTVVGYSGWTALAVSTFAWAAFAIPDARLISGTLLHAEAPRPPKPWQRSASALVSRLQAAYPLALGPGRIAGTLKVLTLPAAREVRLHDRRTGQLLRTTTSAPDGTYSFGRLQLDRPYMVVGLDDTGQPSMYNAAVADMVEAGP